MKRFCAGKRRRTGGNIQASRFQRYLSKVTVLLDGTFHNTEAVRPRNVRIKRLDSAGTFDKWDATLTFTSTDVTTGVLDIKIQADSVDTGSMKNGKLKGKDFFDVKQNPVITFRSTKTEQTGPDSFAVEGDFTIRGVTRHEKLTLTVSGAGTGSGTIAGTMAFDRKEYGMKSGIPFIKIADRVEVSVNLKGERISGPPLTLKQ